MMSRPDFMAKQLVIIIPMEGDKLSFKNDNMIVTDSEGKVILQSTCYTIFALLIVGNTTITSGLIQRSKKFGFSILMLTNGFRPYCMIDTFAEGNVMLRRIQYEYSGLDIAKHIIHNKIRNQRKLIQSFKSGETFDQDTVLLLKSYLEGVLNARTRQELMSIEGSAAKVYFPCVFNKAKGVVWQGRKPRIKFDMVNALLDIGYTILFNYIDAVTGLFGFDKYVGVLHTPFYMRKSLICDLVEPFRVIVDNKIKTGINLGQFKASDFKTVDGRATLKPNKSGDYTQVFVKEILRYKEAIFIYIRDYYRAFSRQNLSCLPVWEYE